MSGTEGPLRARIGAVVVGSRSPLRTAVWYRWALGLPGDPTGASAHPAAALPRPGPAQLQVTHCASVEARAVEPARLITNFLVDDIVAVEARLVGMETVWLREVGGSPCGTIGTVLDPDGNYVQIIERPGGTSPAPA
jgi:hypothetical protein